MEPLVLGPLVGHCLCGRATLLEEWSDHHGAGPPGQALAPAMVPPSLHHVLGYSQTSWQPFLYFSAKKFFSNFERLSFPARA